MLGLFEKAPAEGRVVRLGTDVAAFALFEPAALAHRSREAFVWWLDPCAYFREASEGRFAAFTVGADGGYVLRLVVPGGQPVLSRAEQRAEVASFEFRLRVRHGRVRLDNLDALPGRDQPSTDDDPDLWVDLPPGPYRVRVHALDGTEDGGLADGEPWHVIAFEPVTEAEYEAIPVGGGPPDLTPYATTRDSNLDAAAMMEADRAAFASKLTTRFPASDAAEGLLIAADAVVLPGEHRMVAVPLAFGEAYIELDWDARMERPGAIPLGHEAGEPVSLVDVTGSSLDPVGGVATLSCRGVALARLAGPLSEGAGEEIETVQLQPLETDAAEAALLVDRADPEAVAALREALRRVLLEGDLGGLGALPDSPLNDWARLEHEGSADVLSRYALRILRLPERERLALVLEPPSRRLARLTAALIAL